ncbi:MAG: PAS domain-containing sensor histidine kinase [Myxococcota bacterium]
MPADLPLARLQLASAAGEHNSNWDELPDGVLVLDQNGIIEEANSAVLDLIQRGREEVVGRRIESITAEEDVLRIVGFETVFAAEQSRDTSVIFLSSLGSRRALLVNSSRRPGGARTYLVIRAAGSLHQELSDTTRWAASEQERAYELARARDALAAKNAALRVAQAELESAYDKIKNEAVARERLENDLRLAQKLEAIGQLAAGVAHEINTPMQYIGDNVSFLSRSFQRLRDYLGDAKKLLDASDETELADARSALVSAHKKLRLDFMLEQIPKALLASQEGVAHVSNIVRAMKSFARVDQGEKNQADINQALRDTLIVAQNEYKNVASIETDFGDVPPVNCFIGRLNQVFLNLIVNAAHAIADAKREGPGRIRVSSRATDGVLEVKIADNGCGVPSEIRHRIFEQFFTTKEVGRGTGQGLAIARNIVVEAHGGSIDFESEVDAGTVFTIRLPIDGHARV